MIANRNNPISRMGVIFALATSATAIIVRASKAPAHATNQRKDSSFMIDLKTILPGTTAA